MAEQDEFVGVHRLHQRSARRLVRSLVVTALVGLTLVGVVLALFPTESQMQRLRADSSSISLDEYDFVIMVLEWKASSGNPHHLRSLFQVSEHIDGGFTISYSSAVARVYARVGRERFERVLARMNPTVQHRVRLCIGP